MDSSVMPYTSYTAPGHWFCDSMYCLGDRMRACFRGLLLPTPEARFKKTNALDASVDVLDPSVFHPQHRDKADVLADWKVETIEHTFAHKGKTITATMRVFESQFKDVDGETLLPYHNHVAISGAVQSLPYTNAHIYPYLDAASKQEAKPNNLRIMQITLYDHSTAPERMDELVHMISYLYNQAASDFGNIDSLRLQSFGAIWLIALEKGLVPLPNTVILDRALSSVRKVAKKVCGCCLGTVLGCCAKAVGWGGNPEAAFINYAHTHSPEGLAGVRVLQVTTQLEKYFSGKHGYGPELGKALREKDADYVNIELNPNPAEYHAESHHSLPADHLSYKGGFESGWFRMARDQQLAEALTSTVFMPTFSTGESKHE